jgi:hypothetical protein
VILSRRHRLILVPCGTTSFSPSFDYFDYKGKDMSGTNNDFKYSPCFSNHHLSDCAVSGRRLAFSKLNA